MEKRIRLRPLTAPPERSCSVEEWAAPWMATLLQNAKLHEVLEKLKDMPIAVPFDWHKVVTIDNNNLLLSLVESPKQVELLHRVSSGKINWNASGVSTVKRVWRPGQPLAHVVLSNLLSREVSDAGSNIVAVLSKMRELGADLRAVDSEGNSLLHIAWEHKTQRLLVYLSDECGCDPTLANAKGDSVIDMEKENTAKSHKDFHLPAVDPRDQKHKKGKN